MRFSNLSLFTKITPVLSPLSLVFAVMVNFALKLFPFSDTFFFRTIHSSFEDMFRFIPSVSTEHPNSPVPNLSKEQEELLTVKKVDKPDSSFTETLNSFFHKFIPNNVVYAYK